MQILKKQKILGFITYFSLYVMFFKICGQKEMFRVLNFPVPFKLV